MSFVKLVLIVAPGLEEELIDLLLAHPAVDGFTGCSVYGNGKQQNMSLLEQVTGRRRRLRYELVLAAGHLAPVLGDLRGRLGPDSIYWVEPVADFGRLGSGQPAALNPLDTPDA